MSHNANFYQDCAINCVCRKDKNYEQCHSCNLSIMLFCLLGKFQCLVQLSTLPVAVCYGCGATSKDAQASAAQNALEYLKIMTKK